LLAACFSVYYACNQHRVFCKLIGKGKVIDWIRTSKCRTYFKPPCPFAVLLISCSKNLLDYALIAYVIGLGVYLGSLWQNQLDTAAGHNDSRNIFLVFLISVPLCYLYSQFAKLKDMDCCVWQIFWETVKPTGSGCFEWVKESGEQKLCGAPTKRPLASESTV
jgi:hypothetical protein